MTEPAEWPPKGVDWYYTDSSCAIAHGDCREILPLMPKVDLVLTDPPYNVGLKYGERVDDNRGDYSAWCQSWFLLLQQKADLIALTPGIVNVGLWCAIQNPKWIMSWMKPAAMGRSPMGFCNWEPILVYGKPKTSKGVDVVIAPIIPDGAVNGHPCPKPLLWAVKTIAQLTEQGTILDPFMGSGTTLRAAKDLGRKAIGIEINEEYCRIAKQRLAQEVLF